MGIMPAPGRVSVIRSWSIGGRQRNHRALLAPDARLICTVRRAGPTSARCARPDSWHPRGCCRAGSGGGWYARPWQAPRARDGHHLRWRVRGGLHYLRDCGPGHVLVEAPTRAGKGVNTMVPTLLQARRDSALIHDFKRELWRLTSGARAARALCASQFNPVNPVDPGVKIQPARRSAAAAHPYETGDVQNLVQMPWLDPDGRGFDNDSHWVQAGMALLTGAMLHMLLCRTGQDLCAASSGC